MAGRKTGHLAFGFKPFWEAIVRKDKKMGIVTDEQTGEITFNANPTKPQLNSIIIPGVKALKADLKAEIGQAEKPKTDLVVAMFLQQMEIALGPKVVQNQAERDRDAALLKVTTLEQAMSDAAEKVRLAEEAAKAVEKELAELRDFKAQMSARKAKTG